MARRDCVARIAIAPCATSRDRLATPDGPCRTAPRARIRDVDDIPPPRWDLTPIERYLDGGFSFGVDRGRTHAAAGHARLPVPLHVLLEPAVCGRRATRRARRRWSSTRSRTTFGATGAVNFDFYDLTAIVEARLDPRVLSDARGARACRITWQLPSGTRSEALDEPVLRAMYRSGCRNVTYAPESGSERTLDARSRRR